MAQLRIAGIRARARSKLLRSDVARRMRKMMKVKGARHEAGVTSGVISVMGETKIKIRMKATTRMAKAAMRMNAKPLGLVAKMPKLKRRRRNHKRNSSSALRLKKEEPCGCSVFANPNLMRPNGLVVVQLVKALATIQTPTFGPPSAAFLGTVAENIQMEAPSHNAPAWQDMSHLANCPKDAS